MFRLLEVKLLQDTVLKLDCQCMFSPCQVLVFFKN
jgi:hypothetical protein